VRSDYKVDRWGETSLKEVAAAFLSAHGVGRSSGSFEITEFVETTVTHYCKKKRNSELRIHLFERADKYDEPANVTFGTNITLHVDRRVWDAAKVGDEYSRFVVAHEVGHIVLHDHNAQSFSSEPSLRIKFAEREYSAEWQADTFAEYLLVPDEAVKRFPDERLLSTICGVPLSLARKRLNTYFSGHGLLTEGACTCGNYSLFRQETGLRCFVCGKQV
jgi:IrrE N-terminal-like domain